jgi:general secretion pathway protein C
VENGPSRSWTDRQAILERNLFQVSTLLPAAPVAETTEVSEEELESTRLPLKLLGTVASELQGDAWAAVEDQQNHKQIVVRVQDRPPRQGDRRAHRAAPHRPRERRQARGARARRGRADRRRRAPARSTPDRGRPAAGHRGSARSHPAALRFELPGRSRAGGGEPTQPAELFSEARILPKYDNGQMVGVQLSSIKPGSLFEEIGIQNGDTVTQVNGITVTSPQDSAALLKELTESTDFQVNVQGANGQTRTPPLLDRPVAQGERAS